MKTHCDNCKNKLGPRRKRFCSNKCKDRYHNRNNPRGYGLNRNPAPKRTKGTSTIYYLIQKSIEYSFEDDPFDSDCRCGEHCYCDIDADLPHDLK